MDRDWDTMISAVWAGGRAVDGVVVASASIHRSLLACWRAFFSAEAAGMVAVLETGARAIKNKWLWVLFVM